MDKRNRYNKHFNCRSFPGRFLSFCAHLTAFMHRVLIVPSVNDLFFIFVFEPSSTRVSPSSPKRSELGWFWETRRRQRRGIKNHHVIIIFFSHKLFFNDGINNRRKYPPVYMRVCVCVRACLCVCSFRSVDGRTLRRWVL